MQVRNGFRQEISDLERRYLPRKKRSDVLPKPDTPNASFWTKSRIVVTLSCPTQEELRSAQIQFEEARESTEKIELKGKVLSALSSIPLTRGKMKRHNVLLEWIEQQRREIAASCAPTQKKGGQGGPKRASPRALRNRPATAASRTNKPPKANGHIRKQSTTRSILSPVDPAKVSKRHGKRRSPRRKMSVPCGALQSAGKTTTDPSTPESRSKQALGQRHNTRFSPPCLFIKSLQAQQKTAKWTV